MTATIKMLSGSVTKALDAVEASDERIVEGYFTDGLIDAQGHMIDEIAMQEAIEDYRQWGNVRDMHGDPVALTLEIGTKAWNYIKVNVIDDNTWKRAKAGIYKGFSVGALVLDGEFVPVGNINQAMFEGLPKALAEAIQSMGEVFRITKLALVEISLVDRPANPRARTLAVKSLDGDVDYLPSVTAGKMQIKSLYGKTEQIEDEPMTENKEMQPETVAVIEETEDKELVVESADTETEQEVADVQSEIPQGVEVNKEMDATNAEAVADVEAEATTEVESFEDRLGRLEAKIDGIADLIASVAVPKAASVEEVDVTEVAEETDEVEAEVEAQATEKGLVISDDQIKAIATAIQEMTISERKSIVDQSDAGDPQDEVVAIQQLNLADLRKRMALTVAANIKRGH